MHWKAARPFVFLILTVALTSMACGIDFGGETAAPEAPAGGAVEEPSAPPAEPVGSAEQYYTEDFDSPNEAWADVLDVKGQDTNLSEFTLETANGFLTFDINTPNLFSYVNYTAYDYEDVRVDARVENRGVNNNNVSLVCRYSEDEGWYEFNIANNGLYWILHGILDESNTPRYSNIYNGGSNKIKQGKDVNEYGIVCREKTLTLYINGVETRTVQDNKFVLRSGQVGVSVSSFDDLPVRVDFDWVKISQP